MTSGSASPPSSWVSAPEPLNWYPKRCNRAPTLTDSGGAAFRATREDGDDETPWHETVGRILGELAGTRPVSGNVDPEAVRYIDPFPE